MLKRPLLAAAAVMAGGAVIVAPFQGARGTHPLWAEGGSIYAIQPR
jgi:hypothetical protein